MRPFGIRIGMFWALFVASVLMFVRNRAAVFFSLFLPLIIMLIFGVLNFEGTTTIQLGIVDEAHNQASDRLVDGLGAYDYIEPTSGSREAELAELQDGDLDFVLVIPSGFDPQPGQKTGLVAYASTADPQGAQVGRGCCSRPSARPSSHRRARRQVAASGLLQSASSRSSRATWATSTSWSPGSWA